MTHRSEEIAHLRKRLANARTRARYWSGNPSFRGFGFQPGKGGRGNHDAEYETALDDIVTLCDQIEKLGGAAPKRSDPKQAFKARFLQMMASLPKA